VSTQRDTHILGALGLDGFAAAIDRDAEVPIGLQLGWALCARIHDGEFRPGQRLPGLRDMAEASGLNVNTVRAVYQRLEQKGLLESQQGSGTFVASTATLPQPSAVGTIAADAAREAEAIGVDPRDVAAALYVAMPHEPPTRSARGSTAGETADTTDDEDAPARRRSLRAQIATLERAIGEIEAEYPGVAPRPAATRGGGGPTLLSAEELERVRSGLVHRLAAVQAAIDERAADAQPAVQDPVETAPDPASAKIRTTVALATP
jgi:DNA-binding transcriptional regulator YhcF (GntR family)